MPTGRFHHHPSFEAINDPGAEILEPRDFRLYIVGLYIKVDSTRMLDLLQYHLGPTGLFFYPNVSRVWLRTRLLTLATQSSCPKICGRREVPVAAIYDQSAKPALMHVVVPLPLNRQVCQTAPRVNNRPMCHRPGAQRPQPGSRGDPPTSAPTAMSRGFWPGNLLTGTTVDFVFDGPAPALSGRRRRLQRAVLFDVTTDRHRRDIAPVQPDVS